MKVEKIFAVLPPRNFAMNIQSAGVESLPPPGGGPISLPLSLPLSLSLSRSLLLSLSLSQSLSVSLSLSDSLILSQYLNHILILYVCRLLVVNRCRHLEEIHQKLAKQERRDHDNENKFLHLARKKCRESYQVVGWLDGWVG